MLAVCTSPITVHVVNAEETIDRGGKLPEFRHPVGECEANAAVSFRRDEPLRFHVVNQIWLAPTLPSMIAVRQ